MSRTNTRVENFLAKSRDAALLAVEIYNKPRTAFRSSGFIVMMIIAWTSLFHAIFEKRKISYFYKKNKVRYIKIDGERKAWEISECLKNYYGSNYTPERKNLEFFIKLRDKIEHRFLPEIDNEIFGECQAMLMNYENLLLQRFGEEYAICENLVFALQFNKILHPQQAEVIKTRQSRDYKVISEFIKRYRGGLKKEILESLNYNFRVYLLPKTANHKTSADFTLEFIKYDPSDPKMAEFNKLIVAIKEKGVPMEGEKAGTVAKEVYKALKDKMPTGWRFNASSHHVRCWKYYKIRPPTGDSRPEKTNAKYCYYDKTFGQYAYTKEWINFLIKQLADNGEYKKVMSVR